MHMRPLAALLEELFALHGHNVTAEAALEGRTGTVYTVPILAEMDGRAIVVSGHLDGSPVPFQAVADFADTVSDVGADLGILVHTGSCPAEAAVAAGAQVVLWDRAMVVRLLGDAQVARSLDEPPTPLPLQVASAPGPIDSEVATSLSELLPPSFLDHTAPIAESASLVGAGPTGVNDTWATDWDTEMVPSLDALDGLASPSDAPMPVEAALVEQALAAQWGITEEVPRTPEPVEEDFGPFPPIPGKAHVLPSFPAPLSDAEAESMPPEHPLSLALPTMVQPVNARPSRRPAAAPAWQPEGAAAAPSAFGTLAASAARFAPPMVAPQANASQPVPAVSHLPPAAYLPSTLPPSAPAPPMPAAPTYAPVGATTPVVLPASNPLPPFPAARAPVLPVRFPLEDARACVRERLFSVRAVEVLLQPVHLFAYECDVLKEGSLAYDTQDGLLQVHGSDKSTLDLDADQANPNAPSLLAGGHPYAVEERVLRVTPERAQALALQHVVAKHTRSVSVRIPDHNNSLFYTEKRKVAPTQDQVRLQAKGVFFRPVWRLHGANGMVDVDANDGRILMSEVRGERTGAMLLE